MFEIDLCESAPLEAQEQPGGRVMTANGAPVAVANIADAAMGAANRVAATFPWLAPLIEAAVIGGKQGVGQVRVMTPYGDDSTGEYSDLDAHSAYVRHVKDGINAQQPWLWPLLANASAWVVIAPSCFSFAVSTQPGAQWDIPDLTPLVALDPVSYASQVKH